MTLTEAIEVIEKQIPDPSKGLPEEVFLMTTRLVPMINIDLLIKDENGRTLLSWRDDQYAGTGWHIPGGIIRVKEKAEERIKKVIAGEIEGLPVKVEKGLPMIKEIIHSRPTRGHFISLLYRAFLSKEYPLNKSGRKEGERGFLAWHDGCPKNLISVHDVYREYILGK